MSYFLKCPGAPVEGGMMPDPRIADPFADPGAPVRHHMQESPVKHLLCYTQPPYLDYRHAIGAIIADAADFGGASATNAITHWGALQTAFAAADWVGPNFRNDGASGAGVYSVYVGEDDASATYPWTIRIPVGARSFFDNYFGGWDSGVAEHPYNGNIAGCMSGIWCQHDTGTGNNAGIIRGQVKVTSGLPVPWYMVNITGNTTSATMTQVSSGWAKNGDILEPPIPAGTPADAQVIINHIRFDDYIWFKNFIGL